MSKYHFYRSEIVEFVSVHNTVIHFCEHSHMNDFVITMIFNGHAVLKKGTAQIPICPDDVFVIAPYETHALSSDDEVTLLSMCIKKQAVHNFNLSEYKKCIGNALAEISKIIGFLNEKYWDMFSESALAIYRDYHNILYSESGVFVISRNIIEQCPERNKTIEQLAGEIFTSKYHYVRKFKEISGLTPHKFQIQSKIRKSQQLLPDACSIADIALFLGFYDQSHFDNHFRKIVGISPTEYICSVSNFLQAGS